MIISTQLKMTANYINIWNNTSFILYFVLKCCIALMGSKKLHLLKPIIFQVRDGPTYNSTAIITVLLFLLLLLLLLNDNFYTVRKNFSLVAQFCLMITLLLIAISKMWVLVISFYVFLFIVWSYVYWTVHHLDSWIKIDQLMSLALFFAQHVLNASTIHLQELATVCGYTAL